MSPRLNRWINETREADRIARRKHVREARTLNGVAAMRAAADKSRPDEDGALRKRADTQPPNLRTLGKNIKPVAVVADPAYIKKQQRAAEEWLRKNDRQARRKKRAAARKKQKDLVQADNNPKLVAERRKALRL